MQLYICVCVFRLSIYKIDEIDKNRMIWGKKVVGIDFHRLIDTIDIDPRDFIE